MIIFFTLCFYLVSHFGIATQDTRLMFIGIGTAASMSVLLTLLNVFYLSKF